MATILSPEAAAQLLDLTIEELIQCAGDGQVAGAVLDAKGWRFDRDGLLRFKRWLDSVQQRKGTAA